MKTIVAIFMGGALGTILRFTINEFTLVTGYPLGTVIENILGSFLLGIITGWYIHKTTKDWLKAGMGVGFCGGFTTMSTLAADTLFLYNVAGIISPVIYISVSLFGGIFFAALGLMLGELISRSRQKVVESE